MKCISPVDLDFLVSDSNIPLSLFTSDLIKVPAVNSSVYSGFVNDLKGFIRIPEKTDGRLFDHCKFSHIGFTARDGKPYLPVFIFREEGTFFDSEIFNAKPYEGLFWIVLYHGQDNISYGKRFRSEFEAKRFVDNGFVNGFENVSGKLEFYNS